MRERFWELPLACLTPDEWEALCDNCGKCCLIKLEDEDTGEIVYTRLACKLFDPERCQCGNYQERQSQVDDCLSLTMNTIPKNENWLPKSCAYVRRFYNQGLPLWHPLLAGDRQAMHEGGHSVRNKTKSEEIIGEIEEAIAYIDRQLGP